jgi:hypothetical protein
MESPESWFHQRATQYVEAQILFHLNQVGAWTRLRDEGPLTARQVAEPLHLDADVTDTLLDYLFEVDDLLERDLQGRYSLSEFGRQVVERFSDGKADAGQPSINMFDVRVGAYGPVWQNLGRMLKRDSQYGRDFHREGHYAEGGVLKLAMRFWGSLVGHVEEFGAGGVVEVGLTTGLLERLAEKYPGRPLYGLDKDKHTVERGATSAVARGVRNVRWLQGDYFDVDRWAAAVDARQGGLVYSLHFHELLAEGEDRFVEALVRLKALLPNWVVVAFEQPRLPHRDRANVPEPQWLYAQSNILIHHLIGNGKILSREAWMDLGSRAGCRRVTDRACGYLGYRAFAFHL